ncbi:MAG: hypothetical protein K2K32_04305, partial [Muribaculaceae bacterium]|nr:hypothetical protein [Muribaculaceae bacterium]
IAGMGVAAIRIPDHQINLFLIGEIKLKWVAVICCLLTFLGGGGNQAAHIGGLLWGVVFGLMLRTGNDPTLWLSRLKQSSLSNAGSQSKRNADKIVKVLKDRQNDMQRLDQLLDKIRISGYGSLSRKERKELNDLSRNLNKNKE